MAGGQHGPEQALAAGTVPRLPDLVCPDDDRRPLAAHRIQPVPHDLRPGLGPGDGRPDGDSRGRSRRWDALLSPFLYIFYSIPKVVFLPVIIVVLGLGDFPKIFIIAITVFFQIAIMVRDAAKAIPEEQVMTMRSLCGTKWQNFRHLIWPACLPGILTALRTSLGIALALLFITETFAAFSGLGYFIMNRMEVRNYEEMYAAILTLAAIGIIAYMALDIAERKLCPWKK